MVADPASHRTPGQFLNALMKERDWTMQILSAVSGISESIVARLRIDQRRISADIALVLGEVFDVPAHTFLDLQNSYDLTMARMAMPPDLSRKLRARFFGDLPIGEMVKRQWLDAKDIKDFEGIERNLAAFFGVNSSDEIEIPPYAARRSPSAQDMTPAQLAWIRRVRIIAEEMLVRQFSPRMAKNAVGKLTELRQQRPEELRHVPRILAECGIRFVLVETLAKAKIDGACFWLNERSPVIGMSFRYDRIDNFWFVLRHELEHVIQRHGKVKPMVDIELEGERAGVGTNVDGEERIANEAATEFCVPASKLSSFIRRKDPFYTEMDVLGFAKLLGVHPGVVVGQLQHKTGRYDLLRKHLIPVRKFVAPTASVDGWGDVMRVGTDT